jgi:hypothetical protein
VVVIVDVDVDVIANVVDDGDDWAAHEPSCAQAGAGFGSGSDS